MKTKKTVCKVVLFAAAFALAVFAGCEMDEEPVQETLHEGELQVTVDTSTGPKYFSLSSGKEITEPASKDWDIGFVRTRTILTNSGVTAATLSSGGEGGVWYTEKTVFAEVTQSDAIMGGGGILAGYNTDQEKYTYAMSKALSTLNVINFTGYGEGDGANETPFRNFQYDQKQFYTKATSSSYPVTGVVYIVKHGDGVHFSKIQVTDYELSGSSDTFVVRYENLN